MFRVLLLMTASWAMLSCGAREAPPLFAAPLPREIATSLPRGETAEQTRREAVVSLARAMIQGAAFAARDITFSRDPVGFVRAAYWQVEIDLVVSEIANANNADGMTLLYRSAAARNWLHTESPRPGDLIFLDADENATAPAQVAIVERIGADGTLWALGYFATGPAQVAMNLREPEVVTRQGGERVNDILAGSAAVPAAQLFRAFADPFRED